MWVRFDDRYAEHRKVKGLSDGAYRLDSSGIMWASANTTDGVVRADDLPLIGRCGTKRNADELVGRGRWHRAEDPPCGSDDCPQPGPDGWVIHDWLAFQPGKADVERDRGAKRERQRRWRASRNASTAPSQEPVSNASTAPSRDALEDGLSRARGSRPVPSRPGGGGTLAGQPTPEDPQPPPREDQEPDRKCADHATDPDPPPCGSCAEARRRHETWHTTRRSADQQKRSQQATEQAETRRMATARCSICDTRGYLPSGHTCSHDPDRVETATRGAAAARAAIAVPGEPADE